MMSVPSYRLASLPLTTKLEASKSIFYGLERIARAYVILMQERGEFEFSSAEDTVRLTDAVVAAGGARLIFALQELDGLDRDRFVQILRVQSMH